ncbi:MAG: zinc metallopeptidase [Hyphomicrobiaceae bacterium]|nr:zinc metallopeptidase [Hyphomicrobiaceae bacterium]
MKWRDMRRSSNVDDRRGGGGGGFRLPGGFGRRTGTGGVTPRRAGGGGIGMIVILIIVAVVFGINPLELLSGGGLTGGGNAPSTQTPQTQTRTAPSSDELSELAARVFGDTEDVWTRLFQEKGWQYETATLTFFSGSTQSACGFASAAAGPFYCPGDKRVFIDLSFFQQLARRFEAPGDFAQAYVIAHEVGHHIQNQIGILGRFNEARRRMSETQANQLSIRVELQADCFAGVWGHFAAQRGLLETGDIDEALNAAEQIGDDALQRRTQGYVVPESFNHGTSEQRHRWFRRGFETGSIDACDTFTADRV